MPETLSKTAQFGRYCQLLVRTTGTNALDLSQLRIKFAVKRSNTATPNTADIRIYNVSDETAVQIRKDSQIILSAGYTGNYGVIFQGNIKQAYQGRESSVDTFVDIVAGDGDTAYNFAIVNRSLAAGSTQQDHVNAAIAPMNSLGVQQGYSNLESTLKLPRGKVMYGNSKDFLNRIGQSTGQDWSIQNGQLNYVSLTSYLPGERVVLNSKTGMVGTPVQTSEGVNVKCLLNPLLRVGRLIQINNRDVATLKINLTVPNSPENIPAPFSADGIYFLYVVEDIGDTRGQDWYSNLVCLFQDPTTNARNSVSSGTL